MQKNRDVLVVLFAFFCLFVSACKMKHEGAGDTPNLNGSSLDSSQFGLALTAPDSSKFTYEVSIDGEHTDDCIANAGEWVTCIIDMYELDLYAQGYTLYHNFPHSLCTYSRITPYYYAVAPFSYPPTELEYYVDKDGELENCSFTWGNGAPDARLVVPNLASENCEFDYTRQNGLPAGQATHSPATADDIICPFNYEGLTGEYPGGKNCCFGTYKLTVGTDADADGNYAANEIEVTNGSEWGGDAANCFRGPGMIDSWPKDGIGLPASKLEYVPDEGTHDEFEIKAPILVADDLDYPNQELVFASNYFVGPTALAGDETNNVTQFGVAPGIGAYPPALALGYPYFTYECLDSAFDLVARIDVQVRKWNVLGEIEKASGVGDANLYDDPDVDCETGAFTPYPYNDRFDWDTLYRSSGISYLGFSSAATGANRCP